jgi:hypothetical protein
VNAGVDPSRDGRLVVLAAGDSVYVFDNLEAASIQYHLLIGANLDVDTFRVPADRWEQVLAEVRGDDTITIVDVRADRPATDG